MGASPRIDVSARCVPPAAFNGARPAGLAPAASVHHVAVRAAVVFAGPSANPLICSLLLLTRVIHGVLAALHNTCLWSGHSPIHRRTHTPTDLTHPPTDGPGDRPTHRHPDLARLPACTHQPKHCCDSARWGASLRMVGCFARRCPAALIHDRHAYV